METRVDTGMRRRTFLAASAAVPCHLLLASPLALTGCAGASDTGKPRNIYTANRSLYLGRFQKKNRDVQGYLEARIGENDARFITRVAARRFEELLPGLPELAGPEDEATKWLVVGAWHAAYYRTMKPEGYKAADVCRMLYDLYDMEIGRIPREQHLADGKRVMSAGYQTGYTSWTYWTQKRQIPENFVAEFIVGDGEDFDYGVDYLECALEKYFEAQEVPEIAPYFCLADFQLSRVRETGLRRKGTLAQGNGRCDFRFKAGRPVTQCWETEVPKFRARGIG